MSTLDLNIEVERSYFEGWFSEDINQNWFGFVGLRVIAFCDAHIRISDVCCWWFWKPSSIFTIAGIRFLFYWTGNLLVRLHNHRRSLNRGWNTSEKAE
jgi:hypothetical protein